MIERQPVPADRTVLARIVLPEGAEPVRLDRLVSTTFDAFPTRASARKACERGEIGCDGWLSESCRWVRPGDEVVWVEPAGGVRVAPTLHRRIPVLFEDDALAVVLKPAGLPTSGAFAKTVERALPGNVRRSPRADALAAPRAVHRLDGPTAGVLVVAKTRSAHAALGQAFERRDVQKQYRAIVVGKLDGEGVVDAPIDGREARSRYAVVSQSRALRSGWITTVELAPETGRTHQLRRHLASLGHPILGDTKYGLEGTTLFGKGLFLAATAIRFPHPDTGEPVEVVADEPLKFRSFRAREQRRWDRWQLEHEALRGGAPP
ncbi:MAG: RluA family pseudouridine synthase [Myxococcota bacterium]